MRTDIIVGAAVTVAAIGLVLLLAACGGKVVPKAEFVQCPVAPPAGECPDLQHLGANPTIEELEDWVLDMLPVHAECQALADEWMTAWRACGR